MKHKHYDMIVAKAANMDLVVFRFLGGDARKWYEKQNRENHDNSAIDLYEGDDYFLCLPKHKEECLHWLNGGEILVRDSEMSQFSVCHNGWSENTWCMAADASSRIKPRIEKRWIAIKDGMICGNGLYKSKTEAEIVASSANQFIEIEVEV